MLASLTLIACREDPTGPTAMPAAPTAAAVAGSWIARADYPIGEGIWDAASASITNPTTLRTTVYVIGGNRKQYGAAGTLTNAVKAYDASTNAWQAKAPHPLRIQGTNGAVEINGKIYVSGGFGRRWDPQRGVWRLNTLASLYVYDPTSNTWTRKRDMPMATAKGVSAAYQGRLYVATSCYDDAICGDQLDLGALWRYNPSIDRWVMIGRTPHNPGYGAGGFIGGRLYLVGGSGAVDIYDVATNSWSAGPQRPFRFCQPAYTSFQAKLYLATCSDDLSDVWHMLVFDPKAGAWSEAAAPPVPGDFNSTLHRVVVNGQPRLGLLGGPKPGNHFQYLPNQ